MALVEWLLSVSVLVSVGEGFACWVVSGVAVAVYIAKVGISLSVMITGTVLVLEGVF